MKLLSSYAIAASLWICSCALAEMSDNLPLLGISKEELVSRYGQPKNILGPATGYQTYEYPKGLAVVVHDQKVVQYVAKGVSDYRTEKGIRIGSDISDVVAQYGNYTSTEKAADWFSGRGPIR